MNPDYINHLYQQANQEYNQYLNRLRESQNLYASQSVNVFHGQGKAKFPEGTKIVDAEVVK